MRFIIGFLVIVLVSATLFTVTTNRGTPGTSSQTVTTVNTTVTPLPTSSAPKTLSIGYIALAPPKAPQLLQVVPSCIGTKSSISLTFSSVANTTGLILYRDEAELAHTQTTTFTDSGQGLSPNLLEAGKEYCYAVRASAQDPNPKIGTVLSQNSNILCVHAPNCSGIAISGIPTPFGQPTPTPTSSIPTPTRIPIATPTPTQPVGTPTPTPDSRCQSSVTYQGKPVVNVRKFGSDGAAIQAAIDCFKATNGGGSVFIPSGTYSISKKIGIYSNMTVFGDGIDQTILLATATFKDTMMGNDSSRGQQNVAIRDLTLNGGLSAQADRQQGHDGIRLRDLVGGYIYNIKVTQFGEHGIWLSYKPTSDALGYKAVFDFRVSKCQSTRNKGMQIWLDAGERNVVDNCIASAEGDAGGIGLEIGIDGKLSNNLVVSNDVQRNGHGISLTAGNDFNYEPGWVNSNNIVCYNTVKNNLGPGIWDQHGKDNVYIGNIISNNNNNDGHKDVINVNSFGYEEKLPPATDARCNIPSSYAIPAVPPKPAVLGVNTSGTSKEEGSFINNFFNLIRSFF